MNRPNKRYVVRLESEERVQLRQLVSVGKGAARKLTHARVLLLADQSESGPNWTDERIAEGLGVTSRSVERIRTRFVTEGLASALVRKKQCRPSRERLLDGAKEAKLIALCCSKPPEAERIVLVMDNLNTYTPASLYEALAPAEAKRLADKLEIHYTPKHGSWLDMAEIELGILGRQCLDRRIDNAEELTREVAAWEAQRNAAKAKVDWRFTTDDARIRLKKLYPSFEV